MNDVLIVVGGLVAVSALAANRLSTTVVTGPMVFTAAGLLIGPEGFDLIEVSIDSDSVEALLTVTLAVVLFVDATRVDVTALRRDWIGPARLLGISFPVTVALAFGTGYLLFDGVAE